MKDPYKEVFDVIADSFAKQAKMIAWIAERILSVKEYKEFTDEFTKKKDNHDEMIDFVNKK